MKIIKFHSTEAIHYTKYKEMKVDNDINGKIFTERVKTGIPEETRTEYKCYWIPADKIEVMTYFDKKYTVNGIVVDKENFELVIEQLIKE